MGNDGDRLKNKGDAAEATTQALIAASTGYAAGGTAGAAAGATLSLLPYIVGKALPGFFERKNKEAETWWSTVVEENGTDFGARAQIEARLEEPHVQEVIIASFKLVLDRVSPEVLPAIASLTREYVREGKARDPFFRGAGQLLVDLSAEEFADLREMVAWMVDAQMSGTFVVNLIPEHVSGGHVAAHLSIEVASFQPARAKTKESFPLANVVSLFRLLKAAGLADDALDQDGTLLGETARAITCNALTMQRLSKILGAPTHRSTAR